MNMNREEMDKRAYEAKVHLCKWMADNGITPSELERHIGDEIDKNANVITDYLSAPADVVKRFIDAGTAGVSGAKELATLALITSAGVGTLGGIGTAILRRNIENTQSKTESKEMRKSKMKLDAYRKMIHELETDRAAI